MGRRRKELHWWEEAPFALTAMEKRMLRRALWHDYRRPSSYMITISASRLLPPLATLRGDSRVKDPQDPRFARSVPTEVGRCFEEALADWSEKEKGCMRVHETVIMPDHVHFCLDVFRNLDEDLKVKLGRLKSRATIRLRERLQPSPSSLAAGLPLAPGFGEQWLRAPWPGSLAGLERGERSELFERGATVLRSQGQGENPAQGQGEKPAQGQGGKPALYWEILNHALTKLRRYSPAKEAQVRANKEWIPVEEISFFSDGFQDSIAIEDERWERQKRYVLDNPRRLLVKRQNPDLYRERWLVTVGEKAYEALGNIYLLQAPEIVNVRFSSQFTPQKVAANRARWRQCVDNGGVLVSPFINPVEKQMRDEAIAAGGKLILICTHGFPERFSPEGKAFDKMEEGSLLLIGPSEYTPKKEKLSKAFAMDLNKVAEMIAEHPEVLGVSRKPKE